MGERMRSRIRRGCRQCAVHGPGAWSSAGGGQQGCGWLAGAQQGAELRVASWRICSPPLCLTLVEVLPCSPIKGRPGEVCPAVVAWSAFAGAQLAEVCRTVRR